jgi:hypothetical protein
MIWLTWRHLRTQTGLLYGGVLAASVVLAITGPRLARLHGSAVLDQLTPGDHRLFYSGIVVLALAPAVVGAFWGAPLVARELEAGTHRLVWNQSVTRSRWLAVKIGMTTATAALAVGLLSLAITWWAAPVDGAVGSQRGSLPLRLTPIAFGMRALDPVAFTVFALSVGVAAGALLRRAVPAMAVTVVVVVVAQLAVPAWVRPHLLPTASQTVTLSRETMDGISADESGSVVRVLVRRPHPGDWVLSQATVNAAGVPVDLPAWFATCIAPPPPGAVNGTRVRAPDLTGCFGRLSAEGYRQHVVYQPSSRFWPLQWLEAGVLLVASALLFLFTFRWTRRLS